MSCKHNNTFVAVRNEHRLRAGDAGRTGDVQVVRWYGRRRNKYRRVRGAKRQPTHCSLVDGKTYGIDLGIRDCADELGQPSRQSTFAIVAGDEAFITGVRRHAQEERPRVRIQIRLILEQACHTNRFAAECDAACIIVSLPSDLPCKSE